MSNRVGPVIFSNETAREHLEREGEVLSFRTSDRTTGESHVRYGRNEPGEYACRIDRLGAELPTRERVILVARTLHEHAGFETAEGWLDAIREYHGAVPDGGYLYRVAVDMDEVNAR